MYSVLRIVYDVCLGYSLCNMRVVLIIQVLCITYYAFRSTYYELCIMYYV